MDKALFAAAITLIATACCPTYAIEPPKPVDIPKRAVLKCRVERAQLTGMLAEGRTAEDDYFYIATYEPYWLHGVPHLETGTAKEITPLNSRGFAASFEFSLPMGRGRFFRGETSGALSTLTFFNPGSYSEDKTPNILGSPSLYAPNPLVYTTWYQFLPSPNGLESVRTEEGLTVAEGGSWFAWHRMRWWFDSEGRVIRGITLPSPHDAPSVVRRDVVISATYSWTPPLPIFFPTQLVLTTRKGEELERISTYTICQYKPLTSVEELLSYVEIPKGTYVLDLQFGTVWYTAHDGMPSMAERQAHARQRIKSRSDSKVGRTVARPLLWVVAHYSLVLGALGGLFVVWSGVLIWGNRRASARHHRGGEPSAVGGDQSQRLGLGTKSRWLMLGVGALCLVVAGWDWAKAWVAAHGGINRKSPEEQVAEFHDAARKRVLVPVDLGIVGSREGATTEVVVRNPVSEPLTLDRAWRCDCLSVQVDPSPIPPLGEAKVTVSLKPRESGPFGEQLYFKNSKGQAFIVLDVTARVLASCEPDPGLLEIRVDPAYQRPDVVLGEFALVCREESLAPRGMEFCVEQPWVKCRRIAKEGDRVRYQLRLTDVPPVGEHELAWCSPRGQARRSFQPDLPVVRLRVVSPVRVEPAVLDLGIGRVGTDVVGRVSVGDSATSVTVRPGPGWDAQIASYCVERDGSGPPQVKVTLRSSQPVALEGMLDVEAEQPGGPLHRFRLQVLGACQ